MKSVVSESSGMPNRSEVRSILKTGKDTKGQSVHPDSRKMLRVARLLDLQSFGDEVNKANKALDDKLDGVIKNTDMAISADRINFFAFVMWLIDKGVLKEDAMSEYQEFKVKFINDMDNAGEYLRKQEEALLNPDTGSKGSEDSAVTDSAVTP
jgi:hypothetical protein